MHRARFFWVILAAILALICLWVVVISVSAYALPRLHAARLTSAAQTPIQAAVGTLLSAASATVQVSGTLPVQTNLVLPSLTLSPAQMTPTLTETSLPATEAPTEIEPTLTPWHTSTPLTPQPVSRDAWCIPWNTPRQPALVTEILDAVSIRVLIDGAAFTVRYIGLAPFASLPTPTPQLLPSNTPALRTPTPEGMPSPTATPTPVLDPGIQANRSLVLGKLVTLVGDRTERTADGILPRYVIAEGVFVNQALVERGLARFLSQPPDVNCDPLLQQVEKNAQVQKLGQWQPSPTPTRPKPTATPAPLAVGDVVISFIRYKGATIFDPNEFAEIRNDDSLPIQLYGWTLWDSQRHVFHFPYFLIYPGQYCRIYTNLPNPATCGFDFHNPAAIWDDAGECAYLYDSQGVLRSKYCYGD